MKAYLTLLRMVSFVLVFLIGLLAGMAAFVGIGFVGVTNLSLNSLQSMGVEVNTQDIFRPDAEKDVRDFTIVRLFEEIMWFASLEDQATLNKLSSVYGLVLPEEGEQPILDAMRDVPIASIFSSEGMDIALQNVYVGDMFGYVKELNPDFNESGDDTQGGDETQGGSDEGVNPVNSTDITDSGSGESSDSDTGTDTDTGTGTDTDTGSGEGEGNTEQTPDSDAPDIPKYIWYEEGGAEVKGMQAKLASYTLYELLNGKVDIPGLVSDMQIGEIVGYTYNEAERAWTRPIEGDAEGRHEKLTGFLGIVADRKLDDLDGVLDDSLMGDILGYTKKVDGEGNYIVIVNSKGVTQYQWQMEGENGEFQDVDSLMNVVANTKFDEIGGLTNTLTLGDVVGETDCKYINLIKPETPINELSERADYVFTNSTMEMFVAAGLITFVNDEDGSKEAKFVEVFGDYKMNEFIDVALESIPDTSTDGGDTE